ncbi:hypothetical protein P8V03_03970 [Clostridium sp. A1-XYC3]|uniref:HNH nuclease domain-containing protein n=1 Tax=Clostridium tanneri TaxID=3037988 RepID=A0ABU4JQ97_9CLOT|nr:hypothetical protein [Clostridium sp. A1-XYC3]MDW8800307.1 hypothetical protein [Clostridium sp. A1-XYC3]
MNNKQKLKANEYEVKENIAYIKLRKKDGSIIDSKVDVDDLKMVLDKGLWFAEWHKDFNSYLAQSLQPSPATGKKTKEKQSLHSFILGVHTKTPIRHINGDTLDNRRCNIEVYNQNEAVNDYEDVDSETTAVILRDKYGRKKEKTLIDKEDLDKVINSGYSWVHYVSRGEHHAVANSHKGRIFLESFLMNPSEGMITKHINNNTLDNRKVNLNNVPLVEESEDTIVD